MSQDWMDALREATEPPDDAVAQLHARVLGTVGQRRRRRWPYWVAAGIAAAVLLVAVLAPWRPAEVETLALARPAAPVAPVVSFTPDRPREKAHPRGGGSLKQPAVTRAKGGVAAWIRLETSDPNVVILLVSEGDGE